MAKEITNDDIDLLDELGVEAEAESSGGRTAREQRIIAGFEEIERFVQEHGRLPEHGENRDIFERLYAVRLDGIRASTDCREVLKNLDSHGLLGNEPALKNIVPAPDSDDRFAGRFRCQVQANADDLKLNSGSTSVPARKITTMCGGRNRPNV